MSNTNDIKTKLPAPYVQSDTTVGPNNRAIMVLISDHQFEEMMYCINFVQRHRERSRQSYHNRKEKEINGNVARPKRTLAFPTFRTISI